MEHIQNPEADKPVDQLFDDAVAALRALPEQEDDGRMRVQSSAQSPQLMDGQTTITLHSPDDAYRVGVITQEPGVNGLQRQLSIDVFAKGENGYDDIVSVTYVPQQDLLGNSVVGSEVVAPPMTVLTDTDQKFLSDIGMLRPVEQASVLVTNSAGDYQLAQYLAEPEDLAGLGNLPALVTTHVG